MSKGGKLYFTALEGEPQETVKCWTSRREVSEPRKRETE